VLRKGMWSATAISSAAIGLAALSPVAAQAATAGAGAAQAAGGRPLTKVVNLIRDPGAESAKPEANGEGGVVKVRFWHPLKGTFFTAVQYGAPEFPDKHTPGPKHRGKNFFAGGQTGNTSGATQTVSLKNYAHLISSGKAVFDLSGYLGGFSTQGDNARLTVTWVSASGTHLGHTTIGPVTERQRKGLTKLLHRAKSGAVPKGAATAVISLRMIRTDGAYVDGYADNLSLTIVKKK
jgi:hypothetical protein